MTRILVVGDEFISRQARIYAEYRVFSALTRRIPSFRRARVLLRGRDGGNACDKVTCAITVARETSGSVRVRVRAPHAYAAIDRAVDRLGEMLGRDDMQRRSS
jgi:hypothetical protein